ncbi:MAG: TonB-dependent receptor plug domain-containing protein [Opitutus sp.]|nr:TonB-dependent receptor plug domain-containing protein [Opitutus sp.]
MLPALAASASAQDASNSAAPQADGDVVQLNAFTVSTERDYGYRASNSIAGTRSNTPIKDIPLNIQVFTKDLYEDLNITNQIDLERYNASLVNGGADSRSSNPIQQAYNAFLFRGFVQNWGLRDGIRQYDPIDTQGLARVEVVKGPAGPLYGLSYAGGVMNSITKEVDFAKNFTSIRASVQNEGEYRGTIDANYTGNVGIGKFGVRFNGAHASTEDERAHSEGTCATRS